MMGWTLTVLIAVGLTGTARTAMAEPEDPITVLVYVTNQAEITQRVLAHALAEATRIYNCIAVRLVWTENAATKYRFAIRITTKPLGGNPVDLHALGAAPGTKQARGTSSVA